MDTLVRGRRFKYGHPVQEQGFLLRAMSFKCLLFWVGFAPACSANPPEFCRRMEPQKKPNLSLGRDSVFIDKRVFLYEHLHTSEVESALNSGVFITVGAVYGIFADASSVFGADGAWRSLFGVGSTDEGAEVGYGIVFL